MTPCETAVEKARRHVIEAERRVAGQVAWIARLLDMDYAVDDEKDKLGVMRQALCSARAEQARLQALARRHEPLVACSEPAALI